MSLLSKLLRLEYWLQKLTLTTAIFAIPKSFHVEKGIKNSEYNFLSKNIAKFNKYLKHVDWNHVYSSNVISESYTHFHTIVNNGFNMLFPEIISTVIYKNRYPWLRNTLCKSMTVKNNLSTLSVFEPESVSLKQQYKF